MAATNQSPLARLAGNANASTETKDLSKPQNGVHYTGQWLLDRFVVQQSAEGITRMQLVQQAIKKVDTASFFAAVKDMVKLAAKMGDVNKRSAQSVASQLKNVFGALKHREDAMRAAGWDEKTGIVKTNIIAMQVLKAEGIKNDGTKAVDGLARAEASERKRIQRENKAMMDMQAMHEREEGEEFTDYMARIAMLAQNRIEQEAAKEQQELLDGAAKATIKKYGIDSAKILAEHMLYLAANPEMLREPEAEQDESEPLTDVQRMQLNQDVDHEVDA